MHIDGTIITTTDVSDPSAETAACIRLGIVCSTPPDGDLRFGSPPHPYTAVVTGENAERVQGLTPGNQIELDGDVIAVALGRCGEHVKIVAELVVTHIRLSAQAVEGS